MPLAGVLEEANDLLSEAIALRRRVHEQPELGLQNPLTQQLVLAALEPLGLDRVVTGDAVSSVVADLAGDRPGPTLLLRADTDALPMPEDTGLDFTSRVPGAMHACGHDAHTAMLLGAARLLAGRRSDLAGTVRLMFQPGEEGHHGARIMIEEGLLEATGEEPPVAAFAIHQTPTMPSGLVATRVGPLMASGDILRITVTGRGGHASMPHDAVDPVAIACELVGAMQTFVTRKINIFEPAVVTVGSIHAGTTHNVIPETAHLEGTIRTVNEKTRRKVHDGLRRLVDGIAAAHGAEAELDIETGYPVTVNTSFADEARRVAAELLGAERTREMPAPVMGAEDFSYVLQQVPGAMVFLGTRPAGVAPADAAPNHSNRMMLDEAAMATGIALYASVALDLLAP